MNFQSFNPRAPLTRSGESSALWSPRERNTPSALWKGTNHSADQASSLTNQITQLQQQVSALQRQRQENSGMHPFKIYQFPRSMRKHQNSDDWRRFMVRGGLVGFGEEGTGGAELAWGTDYANYQDGNSFGEEYLRFEPVIPSDDTDIDAAAGWHEAVIPADGSTYYFWYSAAMATLTSTGETHGVLFGTSPATAVSLYTGESVVDPNFTTFPSNDPYRTIIGSVTIKTTSVYVPIYYPNTPYVEQRVSENINFPAAAVYNAAGRTAETRPRMRFRGPYDAALWYFGGDVVTQTATSGGRDTISQYVLFPPSSGAYLFSLGPIQNIDPSTHTPTPWHLLSKSLTNTDYVTGAYDASKYYARTA